MYAGIVAGVALVAVLLGTARFAYTAGQDAERVRHATDADLIEKAGQKAAKQAVAAITKQRPVYTTIKQELEREVRTNTVYSDCSHSAERLRDINAALDPAGQLARGGAGADGVRPAASAPH